MTFQGFTTLGWVAIVVGATMIAAGLLGALFERRTR